jgi:hypothetical protein
MKTLLLRTTSLGAWGCKAVSLLVCISPVVPWQLFGGGNDAAFYFLFMICTCATTLFCMTGRWQWLAHLALALPLLVSLKFSGIIVALALGFVGTCALVLGPSSHRVQRLTHWWLALFHAGAIGAVIGFISISQRHFSGIALNGFIKEKREIQLVMKRVNIDSVFVELNSTHSGYKITILMLKYWLIKN